MNELIEKVKVNNTTGFIMPILFKDPCLQNLSRKLVGVSLIDYFFINGFRTAYLNDHDFPQENCIFLVFKPIEFTEKFKNFCEILEEHKEYKQNYDVEDGVIFVFNINSAYKKDIEFLKQGKYSKTSKGFKELFPQYIKNKKGQKELFPNWMILQKHPQQRKNMEDKVGCAIDENAELWDAFNPKYEILNYNEEFVDINW